MIHVLHAQTLTRGNNTHEHFVDLLCNDDQSKVGEIHLGHNIGVVVFTLHYWSLLLTVKQSVFAL